MKKLRSVQSLRAIAALLVLFYHLSDGAFDAGGAGIDIFFLISGFIMGTVGTRETPRVFLARRLLRIAPLYWLVTFAVCGASVFGLLSNFSFDARRIILSMLFIPHLDPGGHIWPLFVPGWTLNLEMLFYAVFAAALFTTRPIVVASALLCALVALGLYGWQAPAVIQWTTPMLLEFVLGLGISQLRKPIPAGVALIGLAGSVVLLAATAVAHIDMTPYRIIVWGLPAGLLLASCIALEDCGRWPARLLSPLEKLGDASYSLYLTHGIVLAAVLKFDRLGHMNAIVSIVAALAIAEVCYLLVERPINRLASKSSWTKLERPKSQDL